METRYAYDGWLVWKEQNDIGTTLATYVYGLYVDEVLTMTRAGQEFFYHPDDMYNVVVLTNAFGIVVKRYEYGDYGRPIDPISPAPVPGDPSSARNPYLFTGRRYGPETGWY